MGSSSFTRFIQNNWQKTHLSALGLLLHDETEDTVASLTYSKALEELEPTKHQRSNPH